MRRSQKGMAKTRVFFDGRVALDAGERRPPRIAIQAWAEREGMRVLAGRALWQVDLWEFWIEHAGPLVLPEWMAEKPWEEPPRSTADTEEFFRAIQNYENALKTLPKK